MLELGSQEPLALGLERRGSLALMQAPALGPQVLALGPQALALGPQALTLGLLALALGQMVWSPRAS